MKIVIDIPDEEYKYIKEVYEHSHTVEATYSYIYYGKPLPEHHGRLIDADKLRETMEKDPRKALSFVDLTDFVWLAPTIIEGSDVE